MKYKKRNIATTLGISTTTLAQLLSIPYSTLSMYNSGSRRLPHEANLRLTKILQALQTPIAADSELLEKEKQYRKQLTKEIQYKQEKLVYRQVQLERKIERYKEKYAQAQNQLKLVQALSALPSENPQVNHALIGIKRNIVSSMKRYNSYTIAYLELELNLLHVTLSQYRRYLQTQAKE